MSVKWGVIGCGQIADIKMIPGIKKAKNAQLVSIMSRSEDKAKKFSLKHGIEKYYTNMEEFLKDSSVDAVYIATPPHLHCQQTVEAAKYGKHILCEKPMALNLKECEKMIEVCDKMGVKLMITSQMRFNPAHIKAKKIIKADLLGEIILIKTQGSFYFPPDPSSWRLNPEIVGGGSLTDMGIHCVDLVRFFAGEVVQVNAFIDNVVFNYPVEDTALVLMKFASGAYGFVESCYSAYYTENNFEINGSKGTLLGERTIWGELNSGRLRAFAGKVGRSHDIEFAPAWGQDSSLGGFGTVMKEYNLPPRDTYAAEVEHFSECIMQNKKPEIDGLEGMRDLQVVKAAYKSANEGKTVKVLLI